MSQKTDFFSWISFFYNSLKWSKISEIIPYFHYPFLTLPHFLQDPEFNQIITLRVNLRISFLFILKPRLMYFCEQFRPQRLLSITEIFQQWLRNLTDSETGVRARTTDRDGRDGDCRHWWAESFHQTTGWRFDNLRIYRWPWPDLPTPFTFSWWRGKHRWRSSLSPATEISATWQRNIPRST